MQKNKQGISFITGIVCAFGLVIVFVFQQYNFARACGVHATASQFFFNKTVRFFLNDALAIGLVWSIFRIKKYVVFALWVQLTGCLLILIPYFILKFYFPSYDGPLLSYLHRLIMNPTLLLLLIPAFYYQQLVGRNKT